MSDRIEAAWARVRALDAAVARSTADGSSFARGVEQGATRFHDLRTHARQGVAGCIPEGARSPLGQVGGGIRRGLDLVNTEPTGLAGAALVGIFAYVVTRLFWTPLSWPASLVNQFVATATPSSCSFMGPENIVSDNVCGTILAALTLIGALVASLGVLLIRLPIRRILSATFSGVPSGLHFLGVPLLATVLFTIGWAGVQYHFPERPGIVADGSFPAVVGLLTYAFARYGPLAQEYGSAVFAWRDGLAVRQRVGALFLTPVVFSLVATPLLHTPVRDQATVMVAMTVGYLLMAPRAASDAAPSEAPR